MFGISTVARRGGVSVRTLRYYDQIGLLRPAWTDPSSGYRWYEPEQLRRLHRIVALRDMGVRLVEVARMLDESVSTDELRGILVLTAAIPVADGVDYSANGAQTFELPGLERAATTVMYGDDFDGGFSALHAWIEQAGEVEAGELREIYLDCDGPRHTWVVELQLALQAHS